MRNASEKFIKALGEYLKKAFSTRVEKANEENPDLGLADIVLWQDGYRGVASGLSEYPGCIILLNGRTLTDELMQTILRCRGVPGRISWKIPCALTGRWEEQHLILL